MLADVTDRATRCPSCGTPMDVSWDTHQIAIGDDECLGCATLHRHTEKHKPQPGHLLSVVTTLKENHG